MMMGGGGGANGATVIRRGMQGGGGMYEQNVSISGIPSSAPHIIPGLRTNDVANHEWH